MSDTEKPSWEWQQEIQATVLLYQSQIDALRQQLEVVTKELEACIWSITPAMAQAQIDQLHRQLGHRDAEITRLTECLVHIREYWNGQENERAMADACHHIADYAHAALAQAKKEQP